MFILPRSASHATNNSWLFSFSVEDCMHLLMLMGPLHRPITRISILTKTPSRCRDLPDRAASHTHKPPRHATETWREVKALELYIQYKSQRSIE